jgi:hypothetical protein
MSKMRIRWAINEGSATVQSQEVFEGTTVEMFFSKYLPGKKLGDYTVRVGGQTLGATDCLDADALVEITPKNFKGLGK